ncbi:MAG: LON peptidase substrate-binding domain-containing protein [Gaiellales bacterium]
MHEIGLFPLPIVLLPSEVIPLHIFEERYRELIGECVDHGSEFGIVLSDDAGLREVGTTAVVSSVLHRLDDGRLNVMVTGRDRFRLTELTEGRSFQTGSIELLVDEVTVADGDSTELLLTAFRELARALDADVSELDTSPEGLSFRLAAGVELDAAIKQELLEIGSEAERVARLTEVLRDARSAVAWQTVAKDRAPTNGRVERPTP